MSQSEGTGAIVFHSTLQESASYFETAGYLSREFSSQRGKSQKTSDSAEVNGSYWWESDHHTYHYGGSTDFESDHAYSERGEYTQTNGFRSGGGEFMESNRSSTHEAIDTSLTYTANGTLHTRSESSESGKSGSDMTRGEVEETSNVATRNLSYANSDGSSRTVEFTETSSSSQVPTRTNGDAQNGTSFANGFHFSGYGVNTGDVWGNVAADMTLSSSAGSTTETITGSETEAAQSSESGTVLEVGGEGWSKNSTFSASETRQGSSSRTLTATASASASGAIGSAQATSSTEETETDSFSANYFSNGGYSWGDGLAQPAMSTYGTTEGNFGTHETYGNSFSSLNTYSSTISLDHAGATLNGTRTESKTLSSVTNESYDEHGGFIKSDGSSGGFDVRNSELMASSYYSKSMSFGASWNGSGSGYGAASGSGSGGTLSFSLSDHQHGDDTSTSSNVSLGHIDSRPGGATSHHGGNTSLTTTSHYLATNPSATNWVRVDGPGGGSSLTAYARTGLDQTHTDIGADGPAGRSGTRTTSTTLIDEATVVLTQHWGGGASTTTLTNRASPSPGDPDIVSYTPQFPFGADAYQGVGAAPHDGAPSMDDLHDLLDLLGAVPGVGIAPDLVNAALYLYEGDTTNAAWSAAASVFDVAIAGKLAKGAVALGGKVAGAAKFAGKATGAIGGVAGSGVKAAIGNAANVVKSAGGRGLKTVDNMYNAARSPICAATGRLIGCFVDGTVVYVYADGETAWRTELVVVERSFDAAAAGRLLVGLGTVAWLADRGGTKRGRIDDDERRRGRVATLFARAAADEDDEDMGEDLTLSRDESWRAGLDDAHARHGGTETSATPRDADDAGAREGDDANARASSVGALEVGLAVDRAFSQGWSPPAKRPSAPAAKPRGKPRNQARRAPPGDRPARQVAPRAASAGDPIPIMRRDRARTREDDYRPPSRWRWLAAALIVAMLAWPPLLRWTGNLGRDALALGKAASASRAIEQPPTAAWADWTPPDLARPAFSPDSLIQPVAFAASPPPPAAFGQHLTLQNISTIRVGQRVAGSNPLEEDTNYAWSEPEPSGWRKVRMVLLKESGRLLEAELLRPLDWLKAGGFTPGAVLMIEMPEINARGPALVLDVAPCPPIPRGFGHVVIGTFAHEPDGDIVDVRLAGQAEAIGATADHPFWSEDRQAFVDAGSLAVGERVRTRTAGLVAVVEVSRRAERERVYNLEVHGQHVYEVSPLGVLVHNNDKYSFIGAARHHFTPSAMGNLMARGTMYLGRKAHQHLHRSLGAFLSQSRFEKVLPNGARINMDFFTHKGGVVIRNYSKNERLAALDEFYGQYQNGKYYTQFLDELGDMLKGRNFK